jgi:hypothetical protein
MASKEQKKTVRFSGISHEHWTHDEKTVTIPIETKIHDGIRPGTGIFDMLEVLYGYFNVSDKTLTRDSPGRFTYLMTIDDVSRLRALKAELLQLCKRVEDGPIYKSGDPVQYPIILSGARGYNMTLTFQFIPFIKNFILPRILLE